MTDYATTQVLLLCDMTARYATERPDADTNIVTDALLRPVVLKRFRKAKRRLLMASPRKP